MPSYLQEPFLKELVVGFKATQRRIMQRLVNEPEASAAIVEDELRGLYHGLLVTFDGGTALADQGLLSIVDDEGTEFVRYLHEICFDYWPEKPKIEYL